MALILINQVRLMCPRKAFLNKFPGARKFAWETCYERRPRQTLLGYFAIRWRIFVPL